MTARSLVEAPSRPTKSWLCPELEMRHFSETATFDKLEMWANAQRDGRPAEHRWRPSVQRRKVWLTPTT